MTLWTQEINLPLSYHVNQLQHFCFIFLFHPFSTQSIKGSGYMGLDLSSTDVTVNVLKFWTLFTFCFKENVGYQGWNSQNTCQNSKQGRPWSDCFLRSSLIWVCTVCPGPFWLADRVWNFRTFAICPKFTKQGIWWVICLFWFFTSQSTIFQSHHDESSTTKQRIKLLAERHNTSASDETPARSPFTPSQAPYH